MKVRNKFIINTILIFTFLAIIIWLIIQNYKDRKILQKETAEYETKKVIAQDVVEQNSIVEKNINIQKEKVIEKYKGFDVIAKLEIPQINLETYILKNYSENALKISVTKFWGADPNQIGNFCIAGHNFQNKNMFHNLKDLKKGEKLYVTDNNIGKIEYEIYDIYKVYPEDVNCLSQQTNGKKETTLITCTADSEKRIIVKAREKINEK